MKYPRFNPRLSVPSSLVPRATEENVTKLPPAPPGYVREDDIHDVLKKAEVDTVDARQQRIEELFNKFYEDPERPRSAIDDGPGGCGSDAFTAGYDAGEQQGYSVGFAAGAKEGVNGLIGVPDRGHRARVLASGNSLEKPSTKLAAINADQLTAEIYTIMNEYAILPVEVRVNAVLDALSSLPGVNFKRPTLDK